MENPFSKESIDKLVLNEIFAAEKDVGKTSLYSLQVDKENYGKFKSSGIIISTGTGSSGWLFSARRITQSDVRTVLNYLGTNHEHSELVEEHFAKTVSYETLFPPEDDRMYYFIREGYAKDIHNRHKEGFANEIEFQSELIEGRVYIDGYFTKEIGLGDSFTVDSKPEYRLKCIKFLV
jgi:NAD+ kinase